MDSQNFIDKGLKNYISLYDIYNLLFVLNGARPSFWRKNLEYGYKISDPLILQKIYGKLFKVKKFMNDGYLFYTDKKKVIYDSSKDSNEEIGKVLGYSCPGYTYNVGQVLFNIRVSIEDTLIVTEFCNKIPVENMIKKLKMYQEVLDKIEKKISYIVTVSKKYQDKTKFIWMNYFFNENYRQLILGSKIKIILIPTYNCEYKEGDKLVLHYNDTKTFYIDTYEKMKKSFNPKFIHIDTIITKVKVFDSFDKAIKYTKLKNTFPGINSYKEAYNLYIKKEKKNENFTAIYIL